MILKIQAVYATLNFYKCTQNFEKFIFGGEVGLLKQIEKKFFHMNGKHAYVYELLLW